MQLVRNFKIMKNLEQDITINRTNSHKENSLRSIAISLKRIADSLEKDVIDIGNPIKAMEEMSGITAAMKGVK